VDGDELYLFVDEVMAEATGSAGAGNVICFAAFGVGRGVGLGVTG